MAQTYKFGNGTWATKKGSTLAYNDEDNNFKPLPFSFERNSIATRVNKEGLIEVVGNDIPRIDYTDSTEGALLLENSATNLITYSEDFSQSDWVKTGLTVNVNQITSPYGGLNADEVDITTANAHYLFDTISVSASTNYTFTFYVKKGTATDVSYSILNATNFTNIVNTTSYFNEISDTDWTRISVEFTTPSGCTSIRTYPLRDGSSIGTVYIWGAMLEQNQVASSYIPTNGSTVQRAAETCNGSGNSEVFNDSQGVLFANISALSDNGTNRFISLTDGSNDNRVLFGYRASSNQVFARIEGNNSASVDLTNVVSDTEIVIKLAIYYDSSFNYKMYLNGFLVDNAIGTDSIIGLDTFDFTNATGTENFYGKTKEIAYYDEILTDLELETLTSYRSLNEMVTELNLNAL
jgi:hypothetical protein